MGETSPIGPASLIAGRGRGRRARLEAVVLNGGRLEHYRRQLDRADRPWLRVGVVTDDAVGPGELALVAGQLLARVPQAGGTVIYRHSEVGWQPTNQTWPAEVAASRTAPVLPEAPNAEAVATAVGRGWPQALTAEGESVFSYHRRPDGVWLRSSCLRVIDSHFEVAKNCSTKVAQITGELDATPAPGGERRASLSRSLSTAGIRGTDLGVRFEHDGRSFLLFGDTHWAKRPWLMTRDAIAEVHDGELPQVRFHGSPLRISSGTMREYDVPLDAISHGGELYGIFSADHFRNRVVMGRSVLARAVDPALRLDPARRNHPVRFRTLATLSERYFINVAAQLRPAAEVPGCAGDGDVALLWGTGTYRASEVRLAMLDAAALAQLAGARSRVPTAKLGLRYWAGNGQWSTDEGAAVALFSPGAIGELSVRWVPAVGRYLLLAAAGPDDPIGPAISLRWADSPAGPWTPRLRLLDWVAGGMSPDVCARFLKSSSDDPVSDAIFGVQSRGLGSAYAPYFFDARLDGDELVLRYTMSTWNPYQVVLMEHRLVPGEF